MNSLVGQVTSFGPKGTRGGGYNVEIMIGLKKLSKLPTPKSERGVGRGRRLDNLTGGGHSGEK